MVDNVEVPPSNVPLTDENNMILEIWHSYLTHLSAATNTTGSVPEGAPAILSDGGGSSSSGMSALNSVIEALQVLEAIGGVSASGPVGNTGEIQFNKDGAFGADSRVFWDKLNGVFKTLCGVQHKEVRIAYANSPYTVLATDDVIYCNTDSGDIEVLLIAGSTGRHQKVISVGSNNNTLTVTPNGAEEVYGEDSFDMYDGENIDIHWNETEGWY